MADPVDLPPKDYPAVLTAISDLLVEHGHDAEAGTMRAIADGVAALVRGPTLVWPEGPHQGEGGTFHVMSTTLEPGPHSNLILTIEAILAPGSAKPARYTDVSSYEHGRMLIRRGP